MLATILGRNGPKSIGDLDLTYIGYVLNSPRNALTSVLGQSGVTRTILGRYGPKALGHVDTPETYLGIGLVILL